MNEWASDISIDEQLVRALVTQQFPELLPEGSTLRLLGEGWDNAAWLIEPPAGVPVHVVRLPRRTAGLPYVQRELEFLPRLAGRLPLPIAHPLHIGTPSAELPHPWSVCELLPGADLVDADLDRAQRMRLAPLLGAFLRELHRPDLLAAIDPDGTLPVDPNHRADMAVRIPRTREALAAVAGLGLTASDLARAEEHLAAASGLPLAARLVLTHGDLHVQHVLVAPDGTPTGVIDWGDMCASPSSVDLMIVFTAFEPDERSSLLDTYGPVTDALLLRARVLALYHASRHLAYAHHEAQHGLERASLAGIRRALV